MREGLGEVVAVRTVTLNLNREVAPSVVEQGRGKGLIHPCVEVARRASDCHQIATSHARKAKAPASGASRSLIYKDVLVGVRGFEPPASTSRT